MNRLLFLLLFLALAAPEVEAQDLHLQAFAGRTAPAAQDADVFSRSYRGGVTFGLGSGVEVTDHLSLKAAASYQRFNLESPSTILENNLGVSGAGARYLLAGPYNLFAVETNVQYSFSPSASLRPYLLGSLVNQYEYAEGLHVQGDRGGIQTGQRSKYSLGFQVGGGLQTMLSQRFGVFLEALYHADTNSNHAIPIRSGITLLL